MPRLQRRQGIAGHAGAFNAEHIEQVIHRGGVAHCRIPRVIAGGNGQRVGLENVLFDAQKIVKAAFAEPVFIAVHLAGVPGTGYLLFTRPLALLRAGQIGPGGGGFLVNIKLARLDIRARAGAIAGSVTLQLPSAPITPV